MGVADFLLPDRKAPKSCASGPSADEGLELIHAFMKIEDPEKRAQLIRLAQRFSGPQFPTGS